MRLESVINKIVQLAVNQEVQPGEHAGGSGHLAEISFSINSVKREQLKIGLDVVTCFYEKEVFTEFTYEPDNPPYRSNHEKVLIVYWCEKTGGSIEDEEKFTHGIIFFIEHYLLQIEQKYGDCRAPIKYPPYFHFISDNTKTIAACFVDVDLGDNETLVFVGDNLEGIIEKMKEIVGERFGNAPIFE